MRKSQEMGEEKASKLIYDKIKGALDGESLYI